MKQFLQKYFGILLIALTLSACGYHLRGAIDLPEGLKAIYLQAGSSSLREALQQALKSAKGKIVADKSQAALVINVRREELDRRVVSLDSTGRANEFGLTYQLLYDLTDSQGKLLAEHQQIEIHRNYFNNQIDILAKNNEESVIRQEMYRQAVKRILSQARAVLSDDNAPEN